MEQAKRKIVQTVKNNDMAKTLKEIKEAANKKAAEDKTKAVIAKKETTKVQPPKKEVEKIVDEPKVVKEEVKEEATVEISTGEKADPTEFVATEEQLSEEAVKEESQDFEFETYWDQFSHSYKQRLVNKVDANS